MSNRSRDRIVREVGAVHLAEPGVELLDAGLSNWQLTTM
jgi:hypothetical protein